MSRSFRSRAASSFDFVEFGDRRAGSHLGPAAWPAISVALIWTKLGHGAEVPSGRPVARAGSRAEIDPQRRPGWDTWSIAERTGVRQCHFRSVEPLDSRYVLSRTRRRHAPMSRLIDRVIFVTGSTSIAAASAERFAAEGASVFITSRNETTVASSRTGSLRVAGGLPSGRRPADERQARDAVSGLRGRLRADRRPLLRRRGSGRRFGDGPIHEVTGDAWDATMALNLRTQAMACSAVVRQMLAQDPNDSGTRGSILLMGSVTATDPVPAFFATHAYAAAKGAVAALMTTMAATYAADRIRGERRRARADRYADGRPGGRERGHPGLRGRKQPLAGELMDPIDVAHAAVYFRQMNHAA